MGEGLVGEGLVGGGLVGRNRFGGDRSGRMEEDKQRNVLFFHIISVIVARLAGVCLQKLAASVTPLASSSYVCWSAFTAAVLFLTSGNKGAAMLMLLAGVRRGRAGSALGELVALN